MPQHSTTPSAIISTLPILLQDHLQPLLTLILLIPPIDPTTYIRIQYLLRFTSSLRDWITAYPLSDKQDEVVGTNTSTHAKRRRIAAGLVEDQDSSDTVGKSHALSTFRDTLKFLHKLDKGWMTVLAGEPGEVDKPSEVGGSTDEATHGRRTAPSSRNVDDEQVILGKGLSVTDKYANQSRLSYVSYH